MIIDKEKNQWTIPFFLPPPSSLLGLLPHRIICIWYNDPTPLQCLSPQWLFVFDTTIIFPHPRLLPTGLFVFDTTFHIHGCHSHDHLYLIQWSSSTSSFVTTMIVHIHSTSRCPSHSCRNGQILLESTGIHRNGTGIHRNGTGIRRNNWIPAGMQLDSTGIGWIT